MSSPWRFPCWLAHEATGPSSPPHTVALSPNPYCYLPPRSRALLVPAWFDSALLYAVGRVRLEMWLSVLGASTVLAAAVVGSAWGLTGVAIGMLLRSLLMWPLLMVVSCKITGQRVLPLMAKVVGIWAAAALASALAALTGHLTNPIAAVVLGGCLAAVAFLGAALVLARDDLKYLISSLRLLRGRTATGSLPETD